MHLIVEADLQALRNQIKRFEDETKDLKFQFEGLTDELKDLKKSHEEVKTPFCFLRFKHLLFYASGWPFMNFACICQKTLSVCFHRN